MDRVAGGWTNCEDRGFVTFTACWILWGWPTKMGGECGTHEC